MHKTRMMVIPMPLAYNRKTSSVALYAMDASRQIFLDAYDEYADAIFRHCVFRVFSRERAEELVQETFVRFWEYLGKEKKIENIRAFLYRIATNLIIDESRKKKTESLDALLEDAPHLEPEGEGAESVARPALMREALEYMQQLKPEEREIIMMRFVDDLSPKEIAEVLRTNPNVVSVRLHRAIQSLRRILPIHE